MGRGIPCKFRLHLRFAILSRVMTLSNVVPSCQSSVLLHRIVNPYHSHFQRRDVRAQRHTVYRIPYHSRVIPARPCNRRVSAGHTIRSTWDGSFAVSDPSPASQNFLAHAVRIASCSVFPLVRSCRGGRCSRIGNTPFCGFNGRSRPVILYRSILGNKMLDIDGLATILFLGCQLLRARRMISIQ
jgi:hypothetical protein